MKILTLPEVCGVTRLSLATHRFMRHEGTGPKTFKLGRRVVAYEEDVLAWIEEQREADQQRRQVSA